MVINRYSFIFISCFIFAYAQDLDLSGDSSEIPVKSGSTSNSYFYKTFKHWYNSCRSTLPLYRSIGTSYTHTVLTLDELEKVRQNFIDMLKASALSSTGGWLTNGPNITDSFFTSTKPLEPIRPFVQKLIVKPGSVLAFHGDIHGDVHSVVEFIKSLADAQYIEPDSFKIKADNFYIVFLGDYTDRGNYGAEVIYTILRLKIANPERVYLVRGNHEDININYGYGFAQELSEKFKLNNTRTKELLEKITRIYDFMPVALYIGCGTETHKNFIQCCHGGMELGFNPQELLNAPDTVCYQWLGALNQKDALALDKTLINTSISSALRNFVPQTYFDIGFMWNDFCVNPTATGGYCPGRGFEFGKNITVSILKASSTSSNILRAVLRGHQHAAGWTPMMASLLHRDKKDIDNLGLSKLWSNQKNSCCDMWEGLVCTFLVCPDTIYGKAQGSYPGFNYDAYGLVTTAQDFNKWRLIVKRNTIIK